MQLLRCLRSGEIQFCRCWYGLFWLLWFQDFQSSSVSIMYKYIFLDLHWKILPKLSRVPSIKQQSRVQETLNLLAPIKKSFFFSFFNWSSIMRHMSGVRCHVLLVTCHMSHITNAKSQSHGPSPCWLPHYAQQDAAADLDLDPSTLSCRDPASFNFYPY